MLPINLFLPSLPHMADAFRVDFAVINLSIAGFAIAAGFAQLVVGPLSDWFGRRPVALATTLVFVVASIGCALATTIETFLFFRIVQAVVVAGYGVSLAVINETSKDGEAAGKIGYVATAYAIVPMIGPTLGGMLDQTFGWRSSFVLFAVCGLLVFLLIFMNLRETKAGPPQTLPTYIMSYKRLLSSARFWGHASCMAFSIGTLYVFLGAAPLISFKAFDMSAATLGLYIGLVPGGFMLGSYISGRYAAGNPFSFNIILGRIITVAGLLSGLMLATLEVHHALAFFGPCSFIGLGNGLTMPSANAGALSVRPELAGSAAGLASATTLAGGAVIAAISGLFMSEASTVFSVLGIMTAISTLSLITAIFIQIEDRKARRDA